MVELNCVSHGNIELSLWWVCACTTLVRTAADNSMSSRVNPKVANLLNPPYADSEPLPKKNAQKGHITGIPPPTSTGQASQNAA